MTLLPIQLSCYTNNPLGMLQECVFPQMVGAFGGPGLFGLVLGGTIISGLWLAGDGDLATPATVTVLVGGVLFPRSTSTSTRTARPAVMSLSTSPRRGRVPRQGPSAPTGAR